uniref:Trehalase n=1 Tax=Caenorhabditis japonica TaxID=281687 RepID=A0A8R1DLY1_CAEJA
MEKEIQFWEANRIVTLEEGGHQMFVYKADTNCPRPENFLSDFNLGIKKPNPSQVWKSISSACESGWDFTDLSSIHTDQIIPVDLNVIIATNYWIIANLSASLNRESDTSYYQEKHTKLLEAINKVLWDEEHGAWFDFDILANKKNFNFYPSNVYPLMIPGFNHYKYSDRVANYVQKSGVLQFTGGIPSSLPATSSQQWDFPNVWAPNQHFVIQSFLASNNSFLEQEAVKQAEKFIESVYNGLYQSEPGKEAGIWEKYDARSSSGAPGAGGEYVVQEGFGWTNGAVLDLIWTFNSKLKSTRHLELGLTREQHAGLVYTAAGFCAIVALVTLLKGIWKKRQCIESNDDAEAAQSLLATENEEEDDL